MDPGLESSVLLESSVDSNYLVDSSETSLEVHKKRRGRPRREGESSRPPANDLGFTRDSSWGPLGAVKQLKLDEILNGYIQMNAGKDPSAFLYEETSLLPVNTDGFGRLTSEEALTSAFSPQETNEAIMLLAL